MVDESDGIEEAFEGQLRVLVSAAGQVGERLARAREDALRRAQAASVHRADWWDRAGAEQIGHTYQVARAWAHEDPEAVRAEQHMRDELRTRYGLDVDDTGADPAAVRAAVERADRERAQADAERTRSAAENAEAQRLIQEADHEDQQADAARAAAEHEPDPGERIRAAAQAEKHEAAGDRTREDGRAMYDTAERREATARDLEGKGLDHEVVATRMRADVSQAKPATEAVGPSVQKTKAPKARRTRGHAAQVQRAGLDR